MSAGRSVWLRQGADLPEPTGSSEEVRGRADDVLSSSKYDYSDSSFMDEVGDRIADVLEWLFSGFQGPEASGGAGSAGTIVYWLTWLLIAAGSVALVVYIVKVMAGGRLRQGRSRRKQDEVVVEEIMTRNAGEWLTEAEAHEAAGRWRDGILCRYRALVVELGARKVLEEVAGLTAGELRRAMVHRVPSASEAFGRATDLFEDIWYGGAPAGPDQRDQFISLAELTVRAVARPTEPAPVPVGAAAVPPAGSPGALPGEASGDGTEGGQ